jgi:hypothetical protein
MKKTNVIRITPFNSSSFDWVSKLQVKLCNLKEAIIFHCAKDDFNCTYQENIAYASLKTLE